MKKNKNKSLIFFLLNLDRFCLISIKIFSLIKQTQRAEKLKSIYSLLNVRFFPIRMNQISILKLSLRFEIL